MKRTLILAALAALTFASCQKNEVAVESGAESNAITFDVYSARTITKATNVVGIDTLKKYGLGVFGFYTATDDYSKSTHKTPNYMNNQQVKYNDNTSKWEYSPIKYWPNNTGDKLSFFAYAPYHSDKVWDSTNPYISFTVKDNVYGQEDLLFAPGLKNKTKISGRDSLKFVFQHALAKVGFKVAYVRDSTTFDKANNAEIESSTKIVIDTVILTYNNNNSKVKGFFKTANLDMTADTSSAAWVRDTNSVITKFVLDSVHFKKAVTATDSSAKGQIVTATRDTLNNENSYMMIIPQDFSTDSLKITVKYNVWTKDTKLSGNYSKIKNVITNYTKINFEQGKQYMLNLLLGVNSVKIEAEVKDWVDGSDPDIYLPANE